MRRLLLLLGVASAALILAGPAYAARLSLAGTRPVKVHGTGFHHRERVRLTIHESDGLRVVRRVTTSRSGTFKVTLTAAGPPCGTWTANAVGSLGSRAILAGMKFPDCIAQ